jgi:peptide/nickel transport system substrate-binding protein
MADERRGVPPRNTSGGSVTDRAEVSRSSRRRSLAGAFALVTALALVLAACGGGDDSGGAKKTNNTSTQTSGLVGYKPDTAKPTPGGTITYALPAETTGGWCLPEAQLAMSGIQVARAIYDTLTVPNQKGDYVPFLADKVTPSANYTKWTIHLRSGITFHDGTALNAQVVKDNLDAYMGRFKPRSPLLFTFVFDNVTGTKVVDPMTVEVDMKKPWVSFPAQLYSYGRLGIVAEKQLRDGANCYKDMIGTGPFMFKGDWTVNDHITVVKNPHYWRKDKYGQQLPYLDKIIFKPVTETATLVNGLQAKQFDAAQTDSPDAIKQLNSLVSGGQLEMVQSDKFAEIAYNLINSNKAPFDNIDARKAFAYGVNADEYIKVRTYGLVKRAWGPFAPEVLGYLPQSGYPAGTLINYDPTKAKTLVAKYKAETGRPLAFTYSTTPDPYSLQNAQFIQRNMKAVGINMSIKTVEESQLINDAIGGSYQMSAWRNHPGFDPDAQWVWWHCSATPAAASPTAKNIGTSPPPVIGNNCDNPVNFGRFNDSVINTDLEKGRFNADPAVRKAAYEDLNKQFAKQVWNAWAYYALWTIPSQTNLRGQLGPNLPTATNPDAVGDQPFPGLTSGIDISGLWKSSS